MNTASESIFQTIDILVDKALSKLTYDKTVSAEINSIVNLDTGEYKVKYSGNIVSAFSDDIKQEILYTLPYLKMTCQQGKEQYVKQVNSRYHTERCYLYLIQ